VCDLSSAESQFERYKTLMASNYYSLNANTTPYRPEQSTKGFSVRQPLPSVRMQDEVRKPKMVQIYQLPAEETTNVYSAIQKAGVSKEVIDSLGGI
jgi:hypothetical protein